jgi:hypothetical protein
MRTREVHCPRCSFDGYSKIVTPGSFAMEVVLWLFFLLPGIIYSVWRLTARHEACPKCGEKSLVPMAMYHRGQLQVTPNPPMPPAENPAQSILERERMLVQQEAERKECLERAQALEERYQKTKDENLVPRIQALRAAAEGTATTLASVPQTALGAEALEQARLQKEIQKKWEARTSEDLLQEAQSLTEEYKRTHDESLVTRIQALRRTARERQKQRA